MRRAEGVLIGVAICARKQLLLPSSSGGADPCSPQFWNCWSSRPNMQEARTYPHSSPSPNMQQKRTKEVAELASNASGAVRVAFETLKRELQAAARGLLRDPGGGDAGSVREPGAPADYLDNGETRPALSGSASPLASA